MTKVVHLTNVHPSGDNRIFRKECASLAKAGLSVVLIAPGDPPPDEPGVLVRSVRKRPGRLLRLTVTTFEVFWKALWERAAVYHFHDPALIPAGFLLKALGKRVIYDVHEDLSTETYAKEWLPAWMRRIAAAAAVGMEKLADRIFDGIVVATEPIGKRFSPHKTALVRNFAIAAQADSGAPYRLRPNCAVYAGGLSITRGLREMVQASADSAFGDLQLTLLGTFDPPEMRSIFESLPQRDHVSWRGSVPGAQVRNILNQARLGLAVLHPIPNYVESLPTKVFEYMEAAIPVVVSDFPALRKIVESAGCGLVVDPLNVGEIRRAIEWLLANPAEAEAMGRRGREAALANYSWSTEEAALLNLYRRIIDVPVHRCARRAAPVTP